MVIRRRFSARLLKALSIKTFRVEKYRTHELDINPCTGCGKCDTLGRCIIEDSFQEIFNRLVDCDGVVFASPLYFMNVPGRGKMLIDRCQSFWAARFHKKIDLFNGRKRTGMLISCAGAGHGPGKAPVFRGIEDTMTYFFKALGMEMTESLLFPRTEKKDAISKTPQALEKAYNAGIILADLLIKNKKT